MSNQLSNNKIIAKNTLLLYSRMVLILAVQLYSSRVVMQALGVDDYGIYNVVGGVVSIFAFLNAAMSSSTQRYITYYLGFDKNKIGLVFSNCFFVHVIIAGIVLIFTETIGLWFLNNKLLIPESRMQAAFWVFQFSIASTIISILSVPYNACIIAHEKMSAFAYISIFEVLFKLGIALLIINISYDRLIIYAFLIMLAQLLTRQMYVWYCSKHFSSIKLNLSIDRFLLRELFSFVGWNVFGGISNVMYTQGINILLNIFFGPAVNAARGVAVQVQSVVTQFSQNFQTAINPQITRSYATGELKQMHNLIYKSSRYTFFIMLVMVLPVFLEAEMLLKLWLGNVIEWSVVFIRLMLLIVFVDSIANPLMIASAATGKVKKYQTVIGGTMLLIVPVSYILLKFNINPPIVFIVHLLFCLITFVLRLFIIKSMISLDLEEYLREVVWSILKVSGCAVVLPILLYFTLDNCLYNNALVILLSVVCAVVSILMFGLKKGEKQFLIKYIKKYIK